MDLEEFQSNCNSKKCLKQGNRYDSKTCVRSSKQMNCHKAFERLNNKRVEKWDKNKEDWNEQAEFDNEVWLRDTGEAKGETSKRENWKKYCRIWNLLLPEEQKWLEENDEELHFNSKLEIAHIKARSIAPKDIKNIDNVVLIGNCFHRRLTDMIHPITKGNISNDQVRIWLESARDKKRKIL